MEINSLEMLKDNLQSMHVSGTFVAGTAVFQSGHDQRGIFVLGVINQFHARLIWEYYLMGIHTQCSRLRRDIVIWEGDTDIPNPQHEVQKIIFMKRSLQVNKINDICMSY